MNLKNVSFIFLLAICSSTHLSGMYCSDPEAFDWLRINIPKKEFIDTIKEKILADEANLLQIEEARVPKRIMEISATIIPSATSASSEILSESCLRYLSTLDSDKIIILRIKGEKLAVEQLSQKHSGHPSFPHLFFAWEKALQNRKRKRKQKKHPL